MNLPAQTIGAVLAEATDELAGTSDSPRLDAEVLLAWILDVDRSYLAAHPEEPVGSQPSETLRGAVMRRRTREPLAYITGSREFWSLQLKVTPDTLVPRPETELLVEKALELIPRDGRRRVLDLGAGCGAVALAIASERQDCEVDAVESSRRALEVAEENARLHGLAGIRFIQGNWTEPVRGRSYDVIVSNPPYICDDDPVLEILRHEPVSALAAGPHGLDAIRTIATEATAVIAGGGALLLEHGSDQKERVTEILRANGWSDTEHFSDLAGHPRVTRARMNAPPGKDRP